MANFTEAERIAILEARLEDERDDKRMVKFTIETFVTDTGYRWEFALPFGAIHLVQNQSWFVEVVKSMNNAAHNVDCIRSSVRRQLREEQEKNK